MIEDNEKVYRALQRGLDKSPVSYPETESGVGIQILKQLFTPLQALIGSKLGFMPEATDDIYAKFNRNYN